MSGNNHLLADILTNLAVGMFVLAALAGIVIGIALNINGTRTLQFLKSTNHRVSMRRRRTLTDTPRETAESTPAQRRWLAVTLLFGGAYTIFMLLFVVETPYVVVALSQYATKVLVEIAVDSLKWFLLFSGLAAMIAGSVMLAPNTVGPALKARLARYLPSGRFPTSADDMHMTLDHLAETWPRTTGLALASLSLFALFAAFAAWRGQ